MEEKVDFEAFVSGLFICKTRFYKSIVTFYYSRATCVLSKTYVKMKISSNHLGRAEGWLASVGRALYDNVDKRG